MFEVFDHPHSIRKIVVTEETTNQTTGEIIPASEGTPTAVSGHLSDVTQEELATLDAALVKQGVRKFATSSSVETGDVIRVTESDDSTTDWYVEKMMYEASLVGVYAGDARRTYLLKRL